jgi:tRNA (cmo5U34)-methyltransferase
MVSAASKFDSSRAEEYAEQSRIALAGYGACHELAACLLSSILGQGSHASFLSWALAAPVRIARYDG